MQNKLFTSRPRIPFLSRKLPVSKGLFLLVFFSSCLPNTGEKRSLLAGNQKQERLSKKLAVTCTVQNLWTPAVTRTDHSRPQNKDGLWGRECALIERYGNKQFANHLDPVCHDKTSGLSKKAPIVFYEKYTT